MIAEVNANIKHNVIALICSSSILLLCSVAGRSRGDSNERRRKARAARIDAYIVEIASGVATETIVRAQVPTQPDSITRVASELATAFALAKVQYDKSELKCAFRTPAKTGTP